MTQMTIVVAELARRFRFRLAADYPVVPVGHISLRPLAACTSRWSVGVPP